MRLIPENVDISEDIIETAVDIIKKEDMSEEQIYNAFIESEVDEQTMMDLIFESVIRDRNEYFDITNRIINAQGRVVRDLI